MIDSKSDLMFETANFKSAPTFNLDRYLFFLLSLEQKMLYIS